MTNSTTNDLFKHADITSFESFREYCFSDRPDPSLKKIFGMELSEMYEKAEASLTQYFLDDGFPTEMCQVLAQKLLFLMSEARVNGVDVSISTALMAAIHRPSDWVKQVNHAINTGEFTFARLLEELHK